MSKTGLHPSDPESQDVSPPKSWRSHRLFVPAVVVGAMIAAGGGVAAAVLADDDHQPRADEKIATIDGASRLPSTTAEDWVTYADYVVVTRPVSEDPVAEASSETSTDTGLEFRSVKLEVERTLWTSNASKQPAPETLDLLLPGWLTADDGQRLKAAMEHTPRIELGHTYILAISYVEARCSPGDEPEPAHFEPLGENAYVAFDDGIIGQGEVEGETVSGAEAAAAAAKIREDLRSVAENHAGQDIADLVAELKAVKPVERVEYTAPAPCQ